MKLIPFGGKTPSNTAAAVSVDANGMLNTKKTWDTETVSVLVNNESWFYVGTTAKHSTSIDVGDCAMISLLVTSTIKNSSNELVPIQISLERTDSDNDGSVMKDFNGNYIQFNASSSYQLITPDDIPALKYLKVLRFKLLATASTSQGTMAIKVIKKR